MISEGPHDKKPDEPVPIPPGLQYKNPEFQRWGQVRDGTWYAFYANTGPDHCFRILWNEEHPVDPNWWINPLPPNLYSPHDFIACRHGEKEGQCRGVCGSGPRPRFTDEQIEQARLDARHLLDGILW